QNPAITVRLNGGVLERFRAEDAAIDRDYRVRPAPRGTPNRLEISVDRTFRASGDARELTLRLRYLAWGRR
ncbi:MAG TPA: hypothetical protein VFO89_09375, partial [Thermoanaerobaculia bacterium]|nr:hypothetical protein [Thermoanaerobaculia bacterium]